MSRRRLLTWCATLPLLLAGSQVAHGLAYWWAYPQADVRSSVLHASGHGYLAYAPMLMALGAAAELVALGATALDAVRRRAARELPAWTFTLVPAVAFVLQEHLERLVATGVFPWWAVLEPSFWRGLVLQVPVGIAAWLVARLLLRSARIAGRRLVPALRLPRARPASSRPASEHRPGAALVALRAPRGPPCPVV